MYYYHIQLAEREFLQRGWRQREHGGRDETQNDGRRYEQVRCEGRSTTQQHSELDVDVPLRDARVQSAMTLVLGPRHLPLRRPGPPVRLRSPERYIHLYSKER